MLRALLVGSLLACCATALAQGASDDSGRWQLRAEGGSIAVIDQGLRVKTLAAASRDGRERSAVAAMRYLPVRRSFVIVFETLTELWELSIDPQAAPIFDGLVHDYRMGEAVAEPGYLGARRTRLEAPLLALAVDDSGAFVLGRAAPTPDGRAVLHLVQLDVRRTIGRFTVEGTPDLGRARTLQEGENLVMSLPDRQGGAATRVDLKRARLLPPGADAAPR